MKTVLLTGATGLVGREVGKHLVQMGFQVTIVTRNREKALENLPYPALVIEADLSKAPLAGEHSFDGAIHLMGESVAEGRWTPEKKEKLRDSRIASTHNLLRNTTIKDFFISASAVGFYGDRGNDDLTEQSEPGQGFLADLCRDWERAALSKADSVRTVCFRFGIVLSPFGGALAKMIPLFKAHLGGRLGSGEQWMSWIHIDDLVQLIGKAVSDSRYKGVINAVAPNPVTNAEWTEVLAKELDVIKGPPVPALVLKLTFGEMSEALLASQKVKPDTALKLGFDFHYPRVKSALHDVHSYFCNGEIYRSEQYLPIPRDKIFPFFSDAKNLERITPEFLSFHVVKMSTEIVQKGTLIDYKLKLRGLPIRWQTKIEEWDPPHRFVDTQLRGPYGLWRHTHRFETLGPGTLMTDLVRYKLPLGLVGRLAAGSMVASDVEKIFAFRRNAVRQISFR